MKRIVVLIFCFFTGLQSAQCDEWKVTTLNNPSPGYLKFDCVNDSGFYYLDNYGLKQYAKTDAYAMKSKLFKYLENGRWAAFTPQGYFLFDRDMNFIDTIIPKKQAYIDNHDIIHLSTGHYLILYYDWWYVDLRSTFPGADSNAALLSAVIFETDTNGLIYWFWKACDHIRPADMTPDIDVKQKVIDFTHCNSLIEDSDGNFIVSFRHLDEIMKIEKTTGKIMWRLGGSMSKNNEFVFTNDTVDGFVGFSHQHGVVMMPNGNLLMYDNGNLKTPPYSRAVEYKIDQVKKTVTKVWEYRDSPDLYISTMGSACRLENGNTLINWGNKKITEVTPDKKIAYELTYYEDDPVNLGIFYRAFKVPLKMDPVILDVKGPGKYIFNDENAKTGVSLDISTSCSPGKAWIEKHAYAPPVGEYSDSGFVRVMPYRWVFNNSSDEAVSGILTIDTSAVSGLEDPAKAMFFKRNKETVGVFEPLETHYDNATGQLSAVFSGLGEFVVCSGVLAVPSLTYPADGEYKIPVKGTLKWVKLAGATQYEVQASAYGDFSETVVCQIVGKQELYEYEGLKNSTKYYWRVRAFNSKDSSAWSKTYSFVTALKTPAIITPPDNSENNPVLGWLAWSSVADSAKYNVLVSRNESFDGFVIDTKAIQDTIFRYTLLSNTKYFWKVQAYTDSNMSSWSTVASFTTGNGTAVGNNKGERKLTLFPNPARDYFLVKGIEGEDVKFEIYSLDGVLVKKGVVNNGIIYIKKLAAGSYYLRINGKSINFVKK